MIQYQENFRLTVLNEEIQSMNKLHMYRQEENFVDLFITSLYHLVEHCNYHNEIQEGETSN